MKIKSNLLPKPISWRTSRLLLPFRPMGGSVRTTIVLSLVMFCVGVLVAPSLGQVEAITTAKEDLKLGFTVGGKVAKVHVKLGDHVEKDQVLITLEDEEGQALVELYELRANSDLEIHAAEAQLELARIEEKAIRTAYDNGAAMPIEVDRAATKTKLSEIDLDLAKQRYKELKPQLSQAKSRHNQYILKAPTAGFIDMITVSEGELVEDLKPVLQLVVTDPLWIDAAVPTRQSLDIHNGAPAWVSSKLPGYEQPIQGKVIHLAQVADGASDTRLVRVEIPNPEGMPAGCHVFVSFTEPMAASLSRSNTTQAD